MSRKTIVAAMTGAVLLGGLAAPALAGPVGTGSSDGDRASICLRLDPESGREGLCVWLPIPPPGS